MGRPSRPNTTKFFETFYSLMNNNRSLPNYTLYEKTEELYFLENGFRRFANYAVFKVCYHRFTKTKKR